MDPITSTAPRRRTQEQRRTEARQQLLNAAATIITERGLTGLTLADVGERAGYSRGITNHHFGSKAALIKELVQQVCREFGEATEPALQLAAPVEQIVGTCRIFMRVLASLPIIHRAFLTLWAESVASEHELRGVMDMYDRSFRSAVAAITERGILDGAINPDVKPSAFAAALLGQLRGVALQHLLAPDSIDLEEVSSEIQRSVVRSLAPS